MKALGASVRLEMEERGAVESARLGRDDTEPVQQFSSSGDRPVVNLYNPPRRVREGLERLAKTPASTTRETIAQGFNDVDVAEPNSVIHCLAPGVPERSL